MRYSKFEYLWPPRPDTKRAIPAMMLGFYEKQKYACQVKKNGTLNVIFVAPDKTVTFMNRHNESHSAWKPSAASEAPFKALPGGGWYVIVAELLHSKVKGGPRDTNYIFDILVADGDYLVGRTFTERQRLIDSLFPENIGETFSHRIVNENTWVAKLITGGFSQLFKSLIADEDEGLVLKKPSSKLEICSRQSANTGWQVKIRKPTKNFSY